MDNAWVPNDVDLGRPSVARVYDYFLGGSHNFEVDRQFAEQLQRMVPDMRLLMRANRAYLRRAVRHLSAAGIDQFLDLGSGIPTVGNVHEIAHEINPSARVVYVDSDPVAAAHSRTMLEGVDGTAILQADLCRPTDILTSPEVAKLLDLSRPIGLLLVSVLHFVSDEDGAPTAVATLRAAMPAGSYLAISHATGGARPETGDVEQVYRQGTQHGTLRSRAEIAAFFGDYTMIDPGLVWVTQWRPDSPSDVDDNPERYTALAGVGLRS